MGKKFTEFLYLKMSLKSLYCQTFDTRVGVAIIILNLREAISNFGGRIREYCAHRGSIIIIFCFNFSNQNKQKLNK